MLYRIFILFMVVFSSPLFAQYDKLNEVQNLLKKIETDKNQKLYDSLKVHLDMAKTLIDQVSETEETKNDPYTWYYKGFIYKDIFKTKESGNPNSPMRLSALDFLKKSISLDKENKTTESCKSVIKYLSTTFFNDAVSNLNPDNYPVSIKNYDQYKSSMSFAEPNANFRQRNVEFYLALASVYTKISETQPDKKKEFFLKSREIYDKVLELEPDNLGANYNMGILFYNRAVDIINTSNYDIDIVTINQIQDTCINLFRQSLPFMEHAYRLDPANKYVLIGLSGIYFSLNEKEKSEQYKKMLESIEGEEKDNKK